MITWTWISESDYLAHYGTPRHSGRYPWGSGNRPYQRTMLGTSREYVERMSEKQHLDEQFSMVSSEVLHSHPKEKLSELKRTDASTSKEEIRSYINHPIGESQSGREFNCQNCSIAFELVERGYDVCARPKQSHSNVGDIASNFKGGKLSPVDSDVYSKTGYDELYTRYKNSKGIDRMFQNSIQKKMYDANTEAYKIVRNKTLSTIKEQGAGARGIIVVGWNTSNDPSKRTNSFHAFNYMMTSDGIKFFDVQSGREYKQNGGVLITVLDWADPRDVYLMRTDNLELTDKISDAVYSRRR